MILAYAVLVGLAACLLRASLPGRVPQPPDFRYAWLALLAFVPQLLVFHLASTRLHFSDQVAVMALVGTQFLLLLFALANLRKTGMGYLALGLGLNLLVITANGGLMPLRPALAEILTPGSTNFWGIGERLWFSKDVLLPLSETRLWFLSDYFLLPSWFPGRAAFSVGDVFISFGAFWMLLNSVGREEQTSPVSVTVKPMMPTA